jgi:hypothetical protein
MGRNHYLGGHTEVRPGSNWFGGKPKKRTARLGRLEALWIIVKRLKLRQTVELDPKSLAYGLSDDFRRYPTLEAWAKAQPEFSALMDHPMKGVALRKKEDKTNG